MHYVLICPEKKIRQEDLLQSNPKFSFFIISIILYVAQGHSEPL